MVTKRGNNVGNNSHKNRGNNIGNNGHKNRSNNTGNKGTNNNMNRDNKISKTINKYRRRNFTLLFANSLISILGNIF